MNYENNYECLTIFIVSDGTSKEPIILTTVYQEF